ncbi:MAG TPA: sulfotransferase [Acidocella sp.]|nr:MAG: hypothetical protein B7Z81_12710 [Acidocella sp. 20-61-6]HQT46334.1 sulfotransferase [Acidocella sp.]
MPATDQPFCDADADFPIKVVFILSAMRSGSTWLNLVLGSCSWGLNLGEYYRPWRWPGHIACRLCEADGLSECSMLHGIEQVEQRNAFHFAAARGGSRVIIDCSKDLAWCADFLDDARIDARVVHLVRHPAGYVESESRRAPEMGHAALLERWEAENRKISAFTDPLGAAAATVSYDALADNSEVEFARLCRFLGQDWETDALRYWEVPHHGLGGNGAPSVYLRGRQLAKYTTGDDRFYAEIPARPVAADTRFRERLPEAFRLRALELPYAQELMAKLRTRWLP